ncbi:MAG: O-antigen ligase family protein [Chloroflexota bacterium]|nr:O-antigen ligase family protein [Chloroflexota bacterium]
MYLFVKQIARGITRLESLLLVIMLIAFWYPDPRRVWALVLLIPILAARWIARGRLWTPTRMDNVWLAFMGLCLLNIVVADSGVVGGQDNTLPFTRGLMMLGRPILGIVLTSALVESVRLRGDMRRSTWALIALGMLVAILSVGASAWSEKSDQLRFLIDPLPRLPNWDMIRGGFNVNEIGGVLATLVPLMAGIALSAAHPTQRRAAAVVFWIGLFGAMMGQSRLAIGGIIAALFVVSVLLIPAGRRRALAIAGVALLTIIELIILSEILATGQATISDRDEGSWRARLYIWESALDMTVDYPLTGVGLNMFRDGRVRARYPVVGYETQVLPHAHNEWLQLAADMGIPGVLMFTGWYGVLTLLLWRLWRRGDAPTRGIAAACAAGLLAHAIFGLADAIPLWDRFAFVHYAITGLILAQYRHFTHRGEDRVMLRENKGETVFLWRKTNATSFDG